jgi:hypothetical protein
MEWMASCMFIGAHQGKQFVRVWDALREMADILEMIKAKSGRLCV